jgi:copper oxidase (laccase) domain-containing protein
MSGTVLLDLRATLAHQARHLGIEAITVSPWCSAEERDRFFSHRASRGRDGRMVAYIGRALG